MGEPAPPTRPGTVSPWLSKATENLVNRRLEALDLVRVERVAAWTRTTEGAPMGPAGVPVASNDVRRRRVRLLGIPTTTAARTRSQPSQSGGEARHPRTPAGRPLRGPVEMDGCELRTGTMGSRDPVERTPIRGLPRRKRPLEYRDVRLAFCRDEDEKTFGLDERERFAWVSQVLADFFDTQVEKVYAELQTYRGPGAGRVERFLNHFWRFQDAVHYGAAHAWGIPQGSRQIGFAHRYIPQKRLKSPGAYCILTHEPRSRLARRHAGTARHEATKTARGWRYLANLLRTRGHRFSASANADQRARGLKRA